MRARAEYRIIITLLHCITINFTFDYVKNFRHITWIEHSRFSKAFSFSLVLPNANFSFKISCSRGKCDKYMLFENIRENVFSWFLHCVAHDAFWFVCLLAFTTHVVGLCFVYINRFANYDERKEKTKKATSMWKCWRNSIVGCFVRVSEKEKWKMKEEKGKNVRTFTTRIKKDNNRNVGNIHSFCFFRLDTTMRQAFASGHLYRKLDKNGNIFQFIYFVFQHCGKRHYFRKCLSLSISRSEKVFFPK